MAVRKVKIEKFTWPSKREVYQVFYRKGPFSRWKMVQTFSQLEDAKLYCERELQVAKREVVYESGWY